MSNRRRVKRTTVQMRVAEKDYERIASVANELGVSLTTALSMLLRDVNETQGINPPPVVLASPTDTITAGGEDTNTSSSALTGVDIANGLDNLFD